MSSCEDLDAVLARGCFGSSRCVEFRIRGLASCRPDSVRGADPSGQIVRERVGQFHGEPVSGRLRIAGPDHLVELVSLYRHVFDADDPGLGEEVDRLTREPDLNRAYGWWFVVPVVSPLIFWVSTRWAGNLRQVHVAGGLGLPATVFFMFVCIAGFFTDALT